MSGREIQGREVTARSRGQGQVPFGKLIPYSTPSSGAPLSFLPTTPPASPIHPE